MASPGTAPAPLNNTATVARATASARVRVSARWFYWIAGLSLINSAVVIFGGSFHFVVGLGITSVVDALTKQAGSTGIVLDLIINGFVAGLFVLFGSCGSKAQKWAFFVGMGLYALDGLLLLMARDVLSVGFHAYALFCIYKGLAAAEAAVKA
jgi:hypothetical protein